jgi:redox-sensitive bicupin YhaK (pirin superfamily)
MVVPGQAGREGAGFEVRRPFPTRVIDHLDPFLLLDEMGPTEVPPGEARGAPDHPHRGFETVTYLLAGELEHRDSHGNAGVIGPGEVQWMTAGAGVVHSELPSAAFQSRGGRLHGFQLWVNLPRADKRAAPAYQELRAAAIPVARSPDGRATARVIAGEALGARATVRTHTPILYLHLSLQPGGRVLPAVPAHWSALAWVFDGRARAGREGRVVRTGQLVVFHEDGGLVALEADAASGPAELLLLAGEPIGDPVVRYGPFVMNTGEEIVEAFEDFREGRMGSIDPAPPEAARPGPRSP